MPGKVLIIEDEISLAEMLAEQFIQSGFNVYRTTTGHGGIDLARKEQPDLVLLDLLLPDINGEEVYDTLKEEGLLKKTKLIVMTNYGTTEREEKFRKDGVKFIIKSDTTLEEIRKICTEILQK